MRIAPSCEIVVFRVQLSKRNRDRAENGSQKKVVAEIPTVDVNDARVSLCDGSTGVQRGSCWTLWASSLAIQYINKILSTKECKPKGNKTAWIHIRIWLHLLAFLQGKNYVLFIGGRYSSTKSENTLYAKKYKLYIYKIKIKYSRKRNQPVTRVRDVI